MPPLSEQQQHKLRLLTIVSMASGVRVRCARHKLSRLCSAPCTLLRQGHVQHSLLARLASPQHVHSAGAATRSAPTNPHPRTKSNCPSFGPPSRVLQTIPYSKLMGALEVGNIRALEDILITDCFYTGLLRGKLDQERRWADFGVAGGGGA